MMSSQKPHIFIKIKAGILHPKNPKSNPCDTVLTLLSKLFLYCRKLYHWNTYHLLVKFINFF